MVAHVISYDELDVCELLAHVVCGRFRPDQVNAAALARYATHTPEQLLPALRTALIAPDIGGFWRIRGVRLVATDLGFSAGAGPQVRGTAEALLMTGRKRDVS